MEGKKVIIVTGANCGIGLETAKGLCELGHDLIVTARDEVKGEATIKAIKAEVPNAQVMYMTMELEDPQSIRDFAAKFLALGKPLHVLINNVGLFKAYSGKERFSARNDSALEITMIVNCMGPFLLTQLLLDKLKESATESNPARIVNVSSSLTVHTSSMSTGFYIDDLMLEKHEYKSGVHAYRNSKLALNMWSKLLAEKVKEANVLVNTVCPGFIPGTGLARENTKSFMGSVVMRVLDSFVGRLMVKTKPVSEGRQRLVRMAVADDTNKSGLFYVDNKPAAEAPEVFSEENLEKIWELCMKYSGM